MGTSSKLIPVMIERRYARLHQSFNSYVTGFFFAHCSDCTVKTLASPVVSSTNDIRPNEGGSEWEVETVTLFVAVAVSGLYPMQWCITWSNFLGVVQKQWQHTTEYGQET
uniref:Uncharacterized protein n=1 Tax=Anopheles culicifacies TaxID=139723 RepID=A0A182M8N6_9DIPT